MPPRNSTHISTFAGLLAILASIAVPAVLLFQNQDRAAFIFILVFPPVCILAILATFLTRDNKDADITPSDGELSPIPDGVHCPRCAYNLSGSTSARCSECGRSLAGMRAVNPPPWEDRRRHGRFRTFVETVFVIAFRRWKLCDQFAGEISYADARRFRLVVAVVVILSVLFSAGALQYAIAREYAAYEQDFMFQFGVHVPEVLAQDKWLSAAMCPGIILFFLAVTSSTTMFFQPRSMPESRRPAALALAYYACTPLLGIMLAAIWGVGLALSGHVLDKQAIFGNWGILVLIGLSLAGFCFTAVSMLRHIQPHLPGRAAVAAILLPVLWLFLAGVFLVGLPGLIYFVLVVIVSLIG